MEPASKMDDSLLEKARALVAELEAGNETSAEGIIDDLGKLRGESLYQELGKMTRQLHDALNGFPLDPRMQDLAETDIPDAKARLNHVITMTEDSANRTLNAVENTLPIAEQLKSQADKLQEKWQRFRNKDMNVNEFRHMSQEIDDFLSVTTGHASHIHGNLSDVMMAQDFQDLTGQILRRVINLVQEVEDNLVKLICFSGGEPQKDKTHGAHAGDDAGNTQKEKNELMRGVGPQVPGMSDSGGSVSGQDEVDDLLSSLGF